MADSNRSLEFEGQEACSTSWLYNLLNKQQETIANLSETINEECRKNLALSEKLHHYEETQRNIFGQLELITDMFRHVIHNELRPETDTDSSLHSDLLSEPDLEPDAEEPVGSCQFDIVDELQDDFNELPTDLITTIHSDVSINSTLADEHLQNHIGDMQFDNESVSDNKFCSLADQLSSIRKMKHETFICSQPSVERNDSITDDDTNSSDHNTEGSTQTTLPKTQREVKPWPKGTTLVAGDSLIGGLEERKMSAKRHIKVRSIPGATVNDMMDHLKPFLRKKPDRLLLQIGTNDCPFLSADEIFEDLVNLKIMVKSLAPDCRVIFCEIPQRTDDKNANAVRQAVNPMLDILSESPTVLNSNITEMNLSKKGLHLNPSGTRLLAVNIIQYLRDNF